MENYFNLMQADQNSIQNEKTYTSTELREFMTKENVRIVEMQSDGSKIWYNTTFAIAS